MFDSIFQVAGVISGKDYIICSIAAVVLGLCVALIHMYKNEYSKNMICALVIMPVIVQTILMLVNGNIGAGIAVMGTFALVRFRSQPGDAREISTILLDMTIGVALAAGYVGYAVLITLIVALLTVVLSTLSFGDKYKNQKRLSITIPENMDYEEVFDDLMAEYTVKSELVKVKTSNLGSLYDLTYRIVMKPGVSEKAFIDSLRTRNGNLNITIGRAASPKDEL